MALQKQNLSISFAKGLDLKTDPNQVIAGKFLQLENTTYETGQLFKKRSGYTQLVDLENGVNISTFKDELTAFDGTALQSYSPSNSATVNKGAIIGIETSVKSIFRSASTQSYQCQALHPTGLYLYTWTDSLVGGQYLVTSQETGAQLSGPITISTTATRLKAWAIGNYLIVTYIDTSDFHLKYISIPVINPGNASAPVDISTQINSSNPYYDGEIVGGTLYLVWNASDLGGAIRFRFLNAQLNQSAPVAIAGESASSCLTIFADTDMNVPQLWVSYSNGSELKYFIISTSVLVTALPPTLLTTLTGDNAVNLAGYAANGSGRIYYETSNTYPYNSTRTDYISFVAATNSGIVSSAELLIRSIGLASKIFVFNGGTYFVAAQQSPLQNTYFILNTNGTLIGKLAYTNGGGYAPQGFLTEISTVSASTFSFSYLFQGSVATQGGEVFTQTGVNLAIIGFDTNYLFLNTELGQNLNITGGFLWAYDGARPVEQNFHLFPENLSYSATSASTGVFPGAYSYVGLYEWTDNQGNIHRSAPSVPLSAVLSTATSGITVNIPNLRLTAKPNVRFGLYRNAPTIAPTIYYRVNSLTVPTLSSTASDSTAITDRKQDAEIVGNELLYTTGGVVENTGAPSSNAISNYKNRVVLIDSENKNSIWYSKQVIQSTPVEMSDAFKLFVDPRFGESEVLAPMDDKLIVFKPNAIFYYTGNGPDATGGNNDFSESTFVTSTVGSANPKSIALTPVGLMFQSNKGIWLLSRSLQESYIGADVEAFNDLMVTSAVLIPDTTQVRFTLENGTALIYDYYYQIWGTFTNHKAVGATLFQGAFTYIKATGNILQETPGIYTDAGVPFYINLQTSWLSFAGLQGYQRVYGMYLLAKFFSPHILKVSIAYDFNPANTQQSQVIPRDLINSNYGNDPYYGSIPAYGGSGRREQYLINFIKQKCQSVSITIQEQPDTQNISNGASLTLEAMDFLVGAKGGYPRLPPGKSVS